MRLSIVSSRLGRPALEGQPARPVLPAAPCPYARENSAVPDKSLCLSESIPLDGIADAAPLVILQRIRQRRGIATEGKIIRCIGASTTDALILKQ